MFLLKELQQHCQHHNIDPAELPWGGSCHNTASLGDIEIFQQLILCGAPIEPEIWRAIVRAPARVSKLVVLKWLYERCEQPSWPDNFIVDIFAIDNVDIIRWAMEVKVPLVDDVTINCNLSKVLENHSDSLHGYFSMKPVKKKLKL
jgi:hypothetical protein